MMKYILAVLLVTFLPSHVWGRVLTEDTVWQDEVELDEDILVPQGITLTIRPGTMVRVLPAESTKIDPEYLSHMTEITIRGNLNVLGEEGKEVEISVARTPDGDQWAGIFIDHGRAKISYCRISGAEAAVSIIDSEVVIEASTFHDNRYGIVGQGYMTDVRLTKTAVTENDYGLVSLNGAKISRENSTIEQNRKKDWLVRQVKRVLLDDEIPAVSERQLSRMYKSEALVGRTVWRGKIVIDGLVRVPPDAELIIAPGTVIEFTMHDTNNDGIGENGLMVQGRLLAKGTAEAPIVFRGEAGNRKMGGWDAINILGSDRAQNLVEYCVIQNAYRGMHFHFANVTVNNSVMNDNYRGIQFQESLVNILNTRFFGNKSAIQARDSQVLFSRNQLFDNQNGANFFRLDLTARNNIFADNGWDGLRVREGVPVVSNNMMIGNRYGLLVADATFGSYSGNLLADNMETGMALRNSDHITINGNIIQANGINGISIRESRAAIRENLISDNGERGLGILSFKGVITDNNIADNGLYAIGLEGPGDIDATGNWWGGSDLAREIYDAEDEQELGRVAFTPVKQHPVMVTWPLEQVVGAVSMTGNVLLPGQLNGGIGSAITIRPGTVVTFGKGGGIEMNEGRFRAEGTPDSRILFTSLEKKGPREWNEVSLVHAVDSRIANCDFEYATWGLHVHFTDIDISGCLFSHNDGGMRFRSGPMIIRQNLFTDNRIGMRSYRGVAEIVDNVIEANEIGLFIREKAGGLEIHRNNFVDNERYHIRLGDFNTEDVDATGNWWGGADPLEKIFDSRREGQIGIVHYDPVLPAPITFEQWSRP